MEKTLLNIVQSSVKWKDNAQIDDYRVLAPLSLDDLATIDVIVKFTGDEKWTTITVVLTEMFR